MILQPTRRTVRHPVALRDFAQPAPYSHLCAEAMARLCCNHPPHSPCGKSTKHVERDPRDEPSRAFRNSEFSHVRSGFIEPPPQEVLLLNPTFGDRVVNSGRGFVAQPLSSF